MQYALVNNIKTEALKETKGICELCNREVFSRCGDKRINHWAHKVKGCDLWWENETEWHRNWKEKFPINCREVVIFKQGIKHRADVLTESNYIIEFQNSPLSERKILEREEFYGEKLIWVLNATNFAPDFTIQKNPETRSFNLFRMKRGANSISSNQFPFRWIKPKWEWIKEENTFFDISDNFLYKIDDYDTEITAGIISQITLEDFLRKFF